MVPMWWSVIEMCSPASGATGNGKMAISWRDQNCAQQQILPIFGFVDPQRAALVGGTVAGNSASSVWMAAGPPVEAPMVMILRDNEPSAMAVRVAIGGVGGASAKSCGCGRGPWVGVREKVPLEFKLPLVCLISDVSRPATSAKRSPRSPVGLWTTANAPRYLASWISSGGLRPV